MCVCVGVCAVFCSTSMADDGCILFNFNVQSETKWALIIRVLPRTLSERWSGRWSQWVGINTTLLHIDINTDLQNKLVCCLIVIEQQQQTQSSIGLLSDMVSWMKLLQNNRCIPYLGDAWSGGFILVTPMLWVAEFVCVYIGEHSKPHISLKVLVSICVHNIHCLYGIPGA